MINFKKILLNTLFFSSIGLNAASITSNFNVIVNVPDVCIISTSPSDMNFGNYDVMSSTQLTSSTTFGIKCTDGTSYEMTIDKVSGSNEREMEDGNGNVITYDLTYAADGLAWGWIGSGDEVFGDSISSLIEETYTINGTIPINQNVPSGSYSQTNTLNVVY